MCVAYLFGEWANFVFCLEFMQVQIVIREDFNCIFNLATKSGEYKNALFYKTGCILETVCILENS